MVVVTHLIPELQTIIPVARTLTLDKKLIET